MRGNLIYLSLVFVTLLAFSSCSKKKNNFFSRTYHETTTHFNGYFNAKEAVNEALVSYADGYEENWEEPLPIILYPNEQEAVSLYSAMDRAIEKCSKVIDRHSMLINKKQHNSWIDDSYLLMGISYFYKRNFPEAEETFKYITKQFKREPIRHEANLWMARMAIEEKNYVRAQSLLDKLDQYRPDFPKGMDQSYYEVYTHLYLQQKDYENAIETIKQATAVTRKKDRRARQTFLLAQLYDITGQSQRSVRRYGDVVRMNPDYEMKFYAQINQALAFDSRSDSEQIREQLNKLLRDEKYVEFRDQVYYALAEVEFAERNLTEGIENLIKSTKASVNNNRQKGKSFLRLAEIYFEERNYEVASAFYDSTITYLPNDYPRYEIIKNTKESLSDLVHYLKMVDREDSLQTLALMDESDLNRKLRKIIRDKQEEEEERLRKLQEERELAFQNRQNAQQAQADSRASNRAGATGKWYFYNEASKSIGFAEFQAKYGRRELKDNWRRKNQNIGISLGEEGIAESGAETEAGGGKTNIPTMEQLKADIPFSDEAMQASKDTMAHAMFEIGKIYKDRLEDLDNAIETFEELNVRLPGNSYEQLSYYQLYRLFLTKEEDPSYFAPDPRATSAYYAELITEDFPQSEFARLIEDPEYVASNEQARIQETEDYENTFRQYRMRNYTEVLTACLDVMNNDTGNRLLPKYYLLRAMAIAGKKDRENYIAALREIVAKFPETEEGEEAKRLLGLLEEESKPEETATKEDTPPSEEEERQGPKGDYIIKDNMDHYFAILVPNRGVKMNDVKGKVSDFNAEYFRGESFKVTNSFINSEAQILLVRTFEGKEDALHYLGAYEGEETILLGVNDQAFEAFVITSKNFATLFKTKDIDGYIEFFKEYYKR
ncbi:MAG: tetratricopeptide repeat protein [Flavobacteriales bacterium]|nr:tetratricopeptide repeat protein [Flavobacteriales bacterium]